MDDLPGSAKAARVAVEKGNDPLWLAAAEVRARTLTQSTGFTGAVPLHITQSHIAMCTDPLWIDAMHGAHYIFCIARWCSTRGSEW